MPAKSESQSTRMAWTYHEPEEAEASQTNVDWVLTSQVNQTGYFGKRPRPLPWTTRYTYYQMRATKARYDMRVRPIPGFGASRLYAGVSTLKYAPRVDVSHDMSRYNEAISALNSAIRDGRWESGVFLGELKQTSRIFVDSVLQISEFIGSIRRFKRKRVVSRQRGKTRRRTEVVYRASWLGVEKVSRSLAGLWLSYRYGWLPLINDVKDSLALLKKKMRVHDARTFVKSPPKSAFSTSSRSLQPGRLERTAVTRLWFKAMFTPPSDYTSLMARFADQLGLSSPASIAWELTTLSFVVDWLIDIGGYLEALNRPQGFAIGGVESNAFTRVSQTVDPNGTYRDTYATLIASGASSTEDVVYWTRDNIPYPTPRIPDFSPEMNALRVTDAISLLSGNFRRIMRL